MLHRAVASHDASGPKPRSLSQQLFPSSSPSRQESPLSNRSLQPGSNVLQLSNSAALNSANRRSVQPQQHNGIKRTSSGLTKALGSYGSFEAVHKPNSQTAPIVIESDSPVKTRAPDVTQSVHFNEDDFDSDIDLDVEDPSMKESVTYPTLSKPTEVSSTLFYPTLPRRQQLQDGARRTDCASGPGYATSLDLHLGEPAVQAKQENLDSSMPLSWPSSPAGNGFDKLHDFAYQGPAPKRKDAVKTERHLASAMMQPANTGQRSTNEPAKPVKRKTLPWLKNEPAMAQEADNALPDRPSAISPTTTSHKTEFTPLPKDSKKSLYPWNTTASAVKEQQKTLREVNKKKSKLTEATEHAQEIIAKKASTGRVARVFLSDEQQHILNLVAESKRSVFFTGSAGTGKSVLLREIIATLRRKHLREPERVAVTASTGLAACNIGGVTLHSFAGIGLGKEDVPELVKKIRRNAKAKQRWSRTKILVVDEVSMVDGDLFDKLEAIARAIRNNGRPFGGIQLVITGDFFQLPPVPDHNKIAKFAFDAASWTTSIQHTIGLHHVFRQKDPVFAGMLNEMREGHLSQSSIAAFHKLSRPLEPKYDLMATELFPTRNEVENANKTRMDLLVGETEIYEARDGGSIVDKAQRDKLLSNCMAPEMIKLKKGAQVMLIKNIDETLVNGSIGKVIGFMSEQTFDKYTANEDGFRGSQGGTLEGMPADEDPKLAAKSAVERRMMNNMLGSTAPTFPVARFMLADGTTRDLLCQRETWKVELPNGEVQASRAQVPLILAWALSIHKAQGQTLERVKVDLGKVFEKGQAYVALSRATSMAGLQVLRFDPKKVNAHDKVRSFYQQLSRVETLEKGGGDDATAKKRKMGFSADEYEREFLEGL